MAFVGQKIKMRKIKYVAFVSQKNKYKFYNKCNLKAADVSKIMENVQGNSKFIFGILSGNV